MAVKFIGVLHSLGCTKFKHRADIHTKKKTQQSTRVYSLLCI